MKRIICILVVVFCMVTAMPVFAMSLDYDSILGTPWTMSRPSEITVQFNGEAIDFTDEAGNKVVPQLINDRTMVPMRKIFEKFGAKVEWQEADKSIRAIKDGIEINLQIDNTSATVKKDSEVKNIILDATPMIYEDRTLVPVRFIAESLDLKVGWDEWDQTVVIIDTSFIEDEIKEKASSLYSFLTEEYQALESYEMTLEVNSDISYEENKEKESATIKGNGEVKFNPDAMSMNGKLILKGKGEEIEEALSELPKDLTGSMIIDFKNLTIYFKSSLLNEIGYFKMDDLNKWVKLVVEDEEAKEEMQKILEEYKAQSNKPSIKELMDTLLTEDMLYTETYEELKEVIDAVLILCNDQYFKVKETSKGKTYTYQLDKAGLKQVMSAVYELEYSDYYDSPEEMMEDVEEELEGLANLELNIEFEVTDKVVKSFNGFLNLDVKDSYTSYWEDGATTTYRYIIKGDAKVNLESYNQQVDIKMPSERETVKFDDVYEDPWKATMERMNFSMISVVTGSLEKQFEIEAKTNPDLYRQTFTDAQKLNYVAQGYGATLLTEAEADKISCTHVCSEMVENYATTITVNTANGKQEIGYYITPKGKVFFWPPIVFEGKSYVNGKDTAKDAKGSEMEGTEATKAGTVYITFENGEKIEVTTKAGGSYTIKGEYLYEEKEIVVEPISKIYENVTIMSAYTSVYDEPKENAKAYLGDLTRGDVFNAQKYSNGWSKVSCDRISGWVKTTRLVFPNEI